MEVRLNKMEMTVSICHFYNFFFFIATSFHIISLTRYLWTSAILTELRQTVRGQDSVRSLTIIYLAGGAFSITSLISRNVVFTCEGGDTPICKFTLVKARQCEFV